MERTLTREQLLRRAAAAGALASLGLPGLARAGRYTLDYDAATDTLTWALPATIRSLDFVHSYDSGTTAVVGLGLEGLLVYDDQGALKPRLARAWSHPDPLTFVYRLRKGVKWWDGTPLTADDVVFSMGQHMNPKVGSQVATFYANVRSIKATSPDTITIKMKKADTAFQYVPAAHAGLIVQKAFSEKHGKSIGTPSVLTMGTGPYRIVKFTPDEGVSLRRNDAYWGKKPAIANVNIKFITEESTRLLAMRTGQINGAFSVPVDQSGQWQRINNTSVVFRPELSVYFFSFDVSSPPWSDIHVRRAVSLAADKRGMLNALFQRHGEVATSLVPPQQWGGVMPQAQVRKLYATFPKLPYNLTLAKAELKKSSVPDGFSATVPYPNGVPVLGKMCLVLSQTLEQLGIKLTVKEVTTDKWLNDLYAHQKLGIQVISFVPDYPDPINYPFVLLGSEHAVKNDLNIANYKNPKADALIKQQQRTTKNAVRARAIGQLLRLAAQDAPYLPIVWPQTAMAISKDFTYSGFNALYFNQPWATKIRSA
jgi:peptide/nickel transport system substrate-binding protein